MQQNDNQPTEIYPDPEMERDVYVSHAPQLPAELFGAPGGGPMGTPFDEQQHFLNMLNSLNTQQSMGNGELPPGFGAAFGNGQLPPNFADIFGGGGGAQGEFPGFAGFPGLDGTNPLFANMSKENQTQVPDTPLKKFLKTKLHIALFGLLSYVIITLGDFKCSVFLIFLLWEIAEIFLLRQHETNQNPIINIVFMFLGISPTKINVLLKWVQLLNKVLRDVAIFLFVFVCSHVSYLLWHGMSFVPADDDRTIHTQTTMAADSVDDILTTDF